MKACVVVPAYNEEKTIGALVDKIRLLGLDILIVDDGSSDHTVRIAKTRGVAVISNEKNLGKGASLIKGFNYAVSKGFDAVICMDADGQHLPEDIPSFIRAAEKSSASMFVGNRMLNPKGMPWVRKMTNKFMSWLISRVIKQRVYDTQCGFRLIKSDFLKKADLKASKFEIETELLTQAGRAGFKIESVAIKTVYAGEKSQINPFLDTLRFIRFMLKEISRK